MPDNARRNRSTSSVSKSGRGCHEFGKAAWAAIGTTMITLFNLILLWDMWPAQWTMGRIAATLKPGRKAKDTHDYRPIHLMSHFAHLFLSALRQRIAQAYRKTRYQLVFVPYGYCIITCFCSYATSPGKLRRAA